MAYCCPIRLNGLLPVGEDRNILAVVWFIVDRSAGDNRSHC